MPASLTSRVARVALLALCALGVGAAAPLPADAQSRPDYRVSASGASGVAFGSEHDFFHVKLTVPVAVGNTGWAVGPSVAAFSEFGADGEAPNNEDRAAVGLELRRAFGVVPGTLAYVGARGMYSFSQGTGSGLYGGAVAGVQYTLERRLAVGLEGQALRSPEEFLLGPGATITLRF